MKALCNIILAKLQKISLNQYFIPSYNNGTVTIRFNRNIAHPFISVPKTQSHPYKFCQYCNLPDFVTAENSLKYLHYHITVTS